MTWKKQNDTYIPEFKQLQSFKVIKTEITTDYT